MRLVLVVSRLAALLFVVFLRALGLVARLAAADRLRRRSFGLARRSQGVDCQRLPRSERHVGMLGPRVHGNGTVFQHAPRCGAEFFGYDLRRALEWAGPFFSILHALKESDRRLRGPALQSRFNTHSTQRKVWIHRSHSHGHGRPWRHSDDRLARLLNRDLGWHIGDHLNTMFH